ncbi:shikimate kinase [Anaerocolumna xylanovorans]|uniref:Shikimate kinase n=1 Tax=Anaerocolumna xylanovorans DSM 12503 TaxID=1121345 RepID=A0A1M7Y0H4_9FIRM|nr:shikimate kinase [Anaerocolumna xylanovorans]SHO45058.1 shikimate kinase [Anaerocolumna xylanovorans DSM 12503]
MDNLILIGFMGCGKTTVGQQLAKRLSYSFLDTDKYIEQKLGQTVGRIFEEEGEEFFRRLETETIKELTGKLNHTVISVGGGLPVRPGNAEALKKLGTVIYLEVSREVLAARLKNDTTRPLLSGKDGSLKMELLYDKRLPFYEAAADIKIVTGSKHPQDVVNNILEKISQ